MIAGARASLAAIHPEATESDLDVAAVRYRTDPGGFFVRYTSGELDFDTMREARLREVESHFGWEQHPDGSRRFEEAWKPAFGAAQQMYPDVEPFLERCRAAGSAVGVLTNASDGMTTHKFDALGLTGRFDVVVTRDTLGVGKPDPKVFRHACEQVGCAPGEAAYVGDELVSDAVGAHDAGLWSWWLQRPTRGRGSVVPDADLRSQPVPDGVEIVASLDEVLPDLGIQGECR